MGAALVTLSLTGRASAQGPFPPPMGLPGQGPPPMGAPGPMGPPMGAPGPMYQPTFANEPVPMEGPQFCPPGGKKPDPSPFSLPNDGSANAFGTDEPENPCVNDGCYVSVGWMMMQRERLGNGVIAVRDPGSNFPGIPFNVDTGFQPPPGSPTLLNFNDISMNWNQGVRASIGWREGYNAFELTGFYLSQTESSQAVRLPGQLDLPFNAFPTPLGFQGDNFLWLQADQAAASSTTALGSVEANYRHVYCRGFEWLIGLRYVDLTERFSIYTDDDSLVAQPTNLTQIATYSIQEHSRMALGQLGFEWECPLLSWCSVGCTGKGAWGANFLQRNIRLERGDGLVAFDTHTSGTQFSHLYDFTAWGTLRVAERIRLRAGYQLLWLVNVPEAHQQVDFNLGNPQGQNSPNGSIFYHGPMVELQIVF